MSPGASCPLFSVIVPAWNAARTVAATLESILAQTCGDFEAIVVDDCSSDETRAVVASYAGDSRIRLVCLDGRAGQIGARNAGIREARGRMLTFLDADDLWLPGKLARQRAYHERHPALRISHTGFEIFDEDGVVRRTPLRWLDLLVARRGRLLPTLYVRNVVGLLTVAIERTLFESAGGFDAQLPGSEDHDLWIRLAEQGCRFGYVPDILARYRISAAMSSFWPGKLEAGCRSLLERRVLANPRVSARTRRRALAHFYGFFGRRRLLAGDVAGGWEYLHRAVATQPVGLVSLGIAPLLATAFLKTRGGGRSG